jgi:hypothetical protein
MRFIGIVFLLLVFSFPKGFSQSNDNQETKTDYLSVQTGFIADGYNSLGIRTFFEYQKDLKGNWQMGLSYEHSRHFGFVMTDQQYDLNSDLSLFSINAYYKLNLITNRLFWTCGLGAGALHVSWNDNNRFGFTTNASITLNLRITKRIYLETSPLIVLMPCNRVYFSTMHTEHFNSFYAFTLFPVGIKVKL